MFICYTAELAKSNRSTCRTCNVKIEKGALRIGKTYQYEYESTEWHHVGCVCEFDEFADEQTAKITSSDIKGYSALSKPNKQIIDDIIKVSPAPDANDDDDEPDSPKKKAAEAPAAPPPQNIDTGTAGAGSFAGYSAEISKSNRSRCAVCKETIDKGILRLGRVIFGSGDYKVPTWHHVDCFQGFGEVVEPGDPPATLDDIDGYENLSAKEQKIIQDIMSGKRKPKKKAAAKTGKRKDPEEGDDDDDDSAKKPAAKKAAKARAGAGAKGKGKHKADDDDDSDYEKPKKKAKKTPKGSNYAAMTVPELKEVCKERMLAYYSRGKKGDMVSILEEDDADDDAPIPEEQVAGERQMRADREAAADLGSGYQVLGEYYVKLNQTDIENDYNKFYILQLLFKGNTFILWLRWGRVGEPGEKLKYEFAKRRPAVRAFEEKFKDKTGNDFKTRGSSFTKQDNKYTIVDAEDEEGDGEEAATSGTALGRLTEAQIKLGQGVLGQIEAAIEDGGDEEELGPLSSEFYSLIPTNFGRKRAEVIKTVDKVREKEELLSFYLRMGFEDMEADAGATPISGVLDLAVPKTLYDAAKGLCERFHISSSEKKGKDLEKRQAGGPVKKMGQAQYGSIMLYTSNAIYADLNSKLRNENRAQLKKYFKYLRLFFDAFDCLPARNRRLWRGISVDLYDQYKVGEDITWWGVSSTTQDESVARNFMRGCGGKTTLFIIDSKTACDISEMSFYASEKESLLAPGTVLRIRSSQRKGNVAEIHLEEVGRAVS